MSDTSREINRRILVIDDNRAIHEDFAKILCGDPEESAGLNEAETLVFGAVANQPAREHFQVDSAFQGQDGFAMVRSALTERRPYAIAFIDVRMPPGWDGVDTAAHIGAADPDIQIVICTAHSDYSWREMMSKLGHSDRVVVLKKPFDGIEVQQLADTLSRKWQRAHNGNHHLAALQRMIRARSNELNGGESLGMGDQQLSLAAHAADTRVHKRLILEDELRHAIEAGEIAVHYQPLIDVATERVASLEALARWQHPEQGFIAPSVFIRLAEESGLILPLGELVLRTACRQVAQWERDGLSAVPVAVNISALQLQRQNIVDVVRSILRDTGLQPRQLALELTESALIENLQRHSHELTALRADGVSIEIDDFGTGYSSLSYLKQLPVDAVKIDRTFIGQIDTNAVDAAIVSAIIAMAHSLRLRVVAEGVETAAQLAVLRAHGCEVAQGFFFARPLQPADCKALLAAAADMRFADTPLRGNEATLTTVK